MFSDLVVNALFLTAVNCLKTNQGREFMLPFLDTNHPVNLEITTEKPTTVIIQGQGIHINLTLGANTFHVETLAAVHVQYYGSVNMSVEPAAISVLADEGIWLYVFFRNVAGLMPIPVEHLSTDYVVVTNKEHLLDRNFVVIAAVEDNTTVVLTLNTHPNMICDSASATNGYKRVVTLNRSDVVGFICSGDITGTRIQSTKAVVVISGQECFWDPSFGGTGCILLTEMMMPVETFGTEFILSPVKPRYDAVCRIVPSKTPTRVETNTGMSYIIDDVGYIDVNVSICPYVIQTSNPSTVVIINQYTTTDPFSSETAQMDMAIVPSVDRYLPGYALADFTYEIPLNDIDIITIFGKNQSVNCSNSNILTCDVFHSTIHIYDAAQLKDISNTSMSRGMIRNRQNINQGSLASFPLGILFDECVRSPCQNNATCEEDTKGFVCHCLPGFNGTLCETEINECLSNPCQNNATCYDEINGFVCECEPGFNGTECEIEINECESSPCENNGTCQDKINDFVCQCKPGFNGTLCETEIDECLGIECQNNATCRDQINGFFCECKPGFNGTLCETEIDECLSSPCRNNATCHDEVNRFVCQCQPGFNGTLCETDIDECVRGGCQNNGTCHDQINGFSCECVPGFSGEFCENDIDECLNEQCKNNATCQDEINGFVCQCTPGFTGALCDGDINECLNNPCKNNATCLDEINGYVCQCISGFNGTLCETEINKCLNNPCYNNATCRDKVNAFVCDCEPGFSGTLCENDINECLNDPCQNNATCRDQINEFYCECEPGFTGLQCDSNINECLGGPCKNNATCRDGINEFTCQCKPGFNGTLCEIDLDECSSSPCKNSGTCEDKPGGFACTCKDGFYGTTCDTADYTYTYTRLISAEKSLMTSTGQTVTNVPLETNIVFETSYTTPLVIRNTPGNHGSSEYDCVCTRYGNNSEEEVDPKVLADKIQQDLQLDKNKLIKTIIKYKSQEDDRPSAKGIGSVGCMVIVLSILVIVVPDIIYVLQIRTRRKTIRGGLWTVFELVP